MEIIDNRLAVEVKWLVSAGVMSYDCIKKMMLRGSVAVLRPKSRSRSSLIAYDSLPMKYQEKITSIYGNVYALIDEQTLQPMHRPEVSKYYDDYICAGGGHLPVKVARTYYATACVMRAIDDVITSAKGNSERYGVSAGRLWERISQMVQMLPMDEWPVALPSNVRSLERRYKEWVKSGDESLIHSGYKTQGSNASKITHEGEQESVLVTLFSDPRNLNDAQVMALYNQVAERMGWAKIGLTTIANRRKRTDWMTIARRRGAKTYDNQRAMQVRRTAPTRPLSLWTMDGWDVELAYQATRLDKQGHSVTTYHNRLTVVVVLDTCGKYPIGYAIGDRETPELIRAALRSAVRHVEDLCGQMWHVAQLQSDNYAIKTLRDTYSQVASKVTPARVGNAKSKIIEPWFGYINKQYCQLQPNWTGFGVTAAKDNQPNYELLSKYRTGYPDRAGCEQQIHAIIRAERQRIGEDYKQALMTMDTSHLIEMTRQQYLMAFGERSAKAIQMRGDGLGIVIGGQRRVYDSFDHELRRHMSERWTVVYDPDCLQTALALSEDERTRIELTEKYVQPMALCDRKEGDAEELQKIRQFNAEEREAIGEALAEHQQRAQEVINGKRELEMLQKFLIVDHRGQHKDRRNDARLLSELPESDVYDDY